MTWATDRLDAIITPGFEPPLLTRTLRLGLMDAWGPGWVKKTWEPAPEVLSVDGSMFGGHLAALADQVLTFAAMTVAPDDAHFRTINLQLQFVKIGRAHPLEIEGRVVAQSKQLITVAADFRRPDGVLITTASAQQILTPRQDR